MCMCVHYHLEVVSFLWKFFCFARGRRSKIIDTTPDTHDCEENLDREQTNKKQPVSLYLNHPCPFNNTCCVFFFFFFLMRVPVGLL